MSKIYNLFTILFITTLVVAVFMDTVTYASPYGDGYYGTQVTYGDLDSLTISNNGNINIAIAPSITTGANSSSATGTVTVVSTDVVGFNLYLRAINGTVLRNGLITIPASANVSEAALATNTWGFNTDATTNYIGVTAGDILLKSFSGPADTGNVTSVTYGVSIDQSIQAGNYAATVMYTAVPETN
jgi:hypothetical protein